jgi:hypothetical protein
VEAGFSAVVSILAIGASLVVVLLLVVLSAGSSSKSGSAPSVLSNSRAEEQLQLCVEGRPSTYGNPPSQQQQADCTRELEGQLGGAPVDGVPAGQPSGATTTLGYPTG